MRKLSALILLVAVACTAAADDSTTTAAPGTTAARIEGSAEVVATANGTEITLDQINALSVSGAGMTPDEFRQQLFLAIAELLLFSQAEKDFGIVASPEEVAAKQEELRAEFESGGQALDDYLVANGVPVDRFDDLARQHVVQGELLEHFRVQLGELNDEEAQVALDAQVASLTEVCARHILVASAEEAETAKQRIAAGEAFAEVAAEVGTDGTAPNGGELGCNAPSLFVDAFAAALLEAEIGEVYGPVQTEFGYHLILVESRQVPAIDDVRAQMDEGRALTEVRNWMAVVLNDAQVEVVEKYGTWVIYPFPQVLPPQS